MAARTASRGASGPWPTWLSAICRQLNASSSRRSDVRFCAPRPVVSPYVGRPRSKMWSASELASVIASSAASPISTGSSWRATATSPSSVRSLPVRVTMVGLHRLGADRT